MHLPTITVVIPTAGRVDSLQRAIDSALHCGRPGEVEIIVVPNGPDRGWERVAALYTANDQLNFLPIAVQHGCAARNHGLVHARGRFVRFLDDDDYLYAEAAHRQCTLLDAEDADVCSGAVDIVLEDGTHLWTWKQPIDGDLMRATLEPARVTQPSAHVFRRAAIGDLRWDETLAVRQDTDWMLRVAAARELRWIRVDEAVGVWVQHGRGRVFRGRDPGPAALRATAQTIIAATAAADRRGCLSTERRVAAADGLWSALQKGLMYEPRYWCRVARVARGLADGRRPPSRLHTYRCVQAVDPLLVEALLVPLRWLCRPLRRFCEARSERWP